MWLWDKLIGKPLASYESEGQKIGIWSGLPILGLDGLSSAAYGPEAALAILLPLGGLGLNYISPIMGIIIAVLAIVYFSYRQTISAYPNGGGSYTVARENLGDNAGLLAASALMLDYILNVAVGISAGVGALVSAIPLLLPYTLPLCLVVLTIVTLINLRGVRDTGLAFAAPTYLFVGTLLIAITIGLFKTLINGGHPEAVISPPPLQTPTIAMAGLWLLLRAFASGCTAMTGVEAVSNAVGAFAPPAIPNAKRTLTAIVAILAILLAGVAYLAQAYHIGAMDETQNGYQTILSQLVAAVAGRGVFYYITLSSIIVVLALSANTSFADFPRLARLLANDHYLPQSFSLRGRRLVYTMGILFLAAVAGLLLIVFRGITDALIPLFAVGAFLAFTMSQAGMVVHWHRDGGKHATTSLMINGVGAIATGTAVIIMLIAKFADGAWITILIIPSLLLLFKIIKHYYDDVGRQIRSTHGLDLAHVGPPIAVVPIDWWNVLNESALRFALQLTSDVVAVHVMVDEEHCADLQRSWSQNVIQPIQASHLPEPKLAILPSPYRLFQKPFLEYVLKLEKENPNRIVAVVVPELVQTHWYQYLLHNQRAAALKEILLRKGNRRIVVINLPWYLDA